MKLGFPYSKSPQSRSSLRSNSAQQRHVAYGIPLLLAALLWIVTVALLDWGRELTHTSLAEGQRAPGTVLAQVDVESQDLAATELLRRQRGDAVLPVFAVNQAPLQSSLRSATLLFDRLKAKSEGLIDTTPEPTSIPGVTIPVEEALLIVPAAQIDDLRTVILNQLEEVWRRGIISVSEKESRFHGVAATGNISIRVGEESVRSPVEIDQLNTPDRAIESVIIVVREQLRDVPLQVRPLRSLVRGWIQPNLMYDVAATERAREVVQRNVQPVSKIMRTGDTLITQGDRVTSQQLEDWRAYQRRLSELQTQQERRLQRVARSALLLFALVIVSGLLQIVRPDIVQSPSRIALLVILSLISITAVKGLLYLTNTSDWLTPALMEMMLPLAFAPLLTTILIGPATAVVIGAWTSFAVAVMLDNSFTILAMGLLVSILVAHLARQVRQRSKMMRIGLWIGLAQMLYGVSLAVIAQVPAGLMAMQAVAALLTGVMVAFLALMILPLFESVFDITTDITLLELSDMGHPMLQRLAMEAPGSYHHSLMVANLAQAAATEIDANALLVRVCAYFHDIGKLTKPEFFVETTQFRENPHDDLSPSMSTLVIISHVKEGVSMARRAKLPKPIIESIEQHHGTGLVAYFYHRAKTQKAEGSNGNGREINEADFRYPGPKPQTAEMGILLLADSVEAASRSMEKSSPSRIENLVNEIVDARLQDGQLDECNLTFAQLKTIKRSMIFTLTNMLHGRVAYPKDENRNQQPTEAAPSAAVTAEAIRSPDYGTSDPA